MVKVLKTFFSYQVLKPFFLNISLVSMFNQSKKVMLAITNYKTHINVERMYFAAKLTTKF